jgi:20S proteasome alpha/beta subunit
MNYLQFALQIFILFSLSLTSLSVIRSRRIEVKDVALMYSDDGEILQIAYAKKAIDKAVSVIGITNGRIGVSLSRVPKRSKLVVPNAKLNYNSLHFDRLHLYFTGAQNDVKYLLCHANTAILSHKVNYGETVTCSALSSELSRFVALALHPRQVFIFIITA